MWVLERLWQNLARRYVEKLTFVAVVALSGPNLRNDFQRLQHLVPSVTGIDTKPKLFVRAAASNAELNATAGQVIDHGDSLCYLYGVMMRQHGHTEAKANTTG